MSNRKSSSGDHSKDFNRYLNPQRSQDTNMHFWRQIVIRSIQGGKMIVGESLRYSEPSKQYFNSGVERIAEKLGKAAKTDCIS